MSTVPGPWETWNTLNDTPLFDNRAYNPKRRSLPIDVPFVHPFDCSMTAVMSSDGLVPVNPFSYEGYISMPPPFGEQRLASDLFFPETIYKPSEPEREYLSIRSGLPLSGVPTTLNYVPVTPIVWDTNLNRDAALDPRSRYKDGSYLSGSRPFNPEFTDPKHQTREVELER